MGAGCTNGLADLTAAAPSLYLCLLLLVATKCRPDILYLCLLLLVATKCRPDILHLCLLLLVATKRRLDILHLCLLLLVATKCRPDILLQVHRHSRTDSTAAGCSPVEHSPHERVSVSVGQSAAGCCTARE